MILVRLVLLVFLFGLQVCSCSESDEPSTPADSDFIRFLEGENGAGRLETAIVSYVDPEGVRVDLIAAVHLGDPSYYRTLQMIFKAYDALLYEMIKPSSSLPVRIKDDDNLLSRFQRNLCRSMNLEFQLDAIDYRADNFVHADLTTTEFLRIWKKKESFSTMFMRVFLAQMQAMQEGMGQHFAGPEVIEALRSEDSKERMKYIFAQEMEHIETLFAGFELGGEERSSTILGERNKAAIRVLKQQMSKGKKKLAIFYGGGHMPDLEDRLERNLGFRKTGQEWFTAWDIPPRREKSE